MSHVTCSCSCDVIPSNVLIMMSQWFVYFSFHVHICEIQFKLLDNPHEFSQIIHCSKDDELLYQNKSGQDTYGF